MHDRARGFLAAAVLLAGMAAPSRAQPSQPGAAVRLLDVPYIQQSEALCGGAAAAMVMRYWGATGVYAETFAPLVDRAAGGIRGEDLLRELRNRGWNARSFGGDGPLVRSRLADGQPVIALIEDRPGAFHYVVVVAWANGRVILHDPARAPFRVLADSEFHAAWEKSGRWTLLTLPGEKLGASDGAPAAAPPARLRPASACDSLVQDAVRTANNGEHDDALRTLTAAADVCPADPAPWREMAGVYALREQWREAAAYARQALRRDREDAHAWRILAASSFVTDDTATALDAWNAVGEPILDIVNIRGLERTRHAAAADAMRLEPQTVLTRRALSAAAKRLAEIPASRAARVAYRPLENGRAAVDAVLIERPRSPFTVGGLAVLGIRAATDRELAASFANPTGAGDLATVSWRWWENRPRAAISYATPVTIGGVLHVDAFRDEQTYPDAREVRRGGSVSLSDWTTTNLRWQLGAGVDGWSGRGTTATVSAGVEQRFAEDRVSLSGNASALAGSFSAWTSAAVVAWRSSTRNEGHVLLGRAGAEVVATKAPLALWPGAGLGHARPTLLRAHPLLDDGTVVGDVFGRRMYHGGVEWRRWARPIKGTIRLAPAAFVDLARADRRLRPGAAWHADAGAGLRIAIPGSPVLRVDVARGLRDGDMTFSVGWIR